MPRSFVTDPIFPYDVHLRDLQDLWVNDRGVDVATLRRYDGKFAGCVGVEQGITNLYLQADWVKTQYGNFNVTDGYSTAFTTKRPLGFLRVPKMGATTPATEVTSNFIAYAVTDNVWYTVSYLLRFDGLVPPTFTIRFIQTGGAGGVESHTPTLINLGHGVWKAMASHQARVSAASIRPSINAITWNDATYMDVGEPLFFAHAGVVAAVTVPLNYSHVWGTRANAILKYPGSLLPRTAGTVSCWIRPGYDYVSIAADWHGIVTSVTSHLSDEFQLWILNTTGQLQWQAYVGGVQQVSLTHSPAAWDPAQTYHVAVTWSDTEQVLYLNGVRRASRSGAFTRWTQGTWVTVGTASSTASANDWLDGGIDDLAILPRQLTDAQIAQLYAQAAVGAQFLGESQLAATSEFKESITLVELTFSLSTLRFSSGPHNVDWNGVTWFGSGSNMMLGDVSETPDFAGQRLRITLDGVSLAAVAALLGESYMGRTAKVWRAYIGLDGLIVPNPVPFFTGHMNAAWEVTEDIEQGYARVETDIVSPLAVMEQVNGVTADLNSHQAVYSGDTFFKRMTTKPRGDFGWGVADSVPIKF